MISTWNSFLDKWLGRDERIIWLFDSVKSFPKDAAEWNRVILINGNTYENMNGIRVDLWQFILPTWPQWPMGVQGIEGAPWKDGKDWKDWKDWLQGPVGSIGQTWPKGERWIPGADGAEGMSWKDGKDWAQWVQWVAWPKWPKGDSGKDGKDWIAPSLEDVAADLLNNPSFVENCTVVWPRGFDGASVEVRDIVFALLQDKEFIKACQIKWDKGDALKFSDLTAAQIAQLKGDTGEGIPGPMWPKWFDWDRIFLQYSPDGVNEWSYKLKTGDKFISIQVWKQEPQVAQFIFN